MQAIRAQHDGVTRLERVAGGGHVDLDIRRDADTARHDIAARIGTCLIDGDLPAFDEIGDERMIARHQVRSLRAHEVRARIPDVPDQRDTGSQREQRAGGAHATALRLGTRLRPHLVIGGFDRARDRGGQVLGRRGREFADHDLGGQRARDLTRVGAAHAVTDHKQQVDRQLGPGRRFPHREAVLVPGSPPPDIGQGRRADVRLGGVQGSRPCRWRSPRPAGGGPGPRSDAEPRSC